MSTTLLCAVKAPSLDHEAAALVVKFDEAISGVLRVYWRCFSPFTRSVPLPSPPSLILSRFISPSLNPGV